MESKTWVSSLTIRGLLTIVVGNLMTTYGLPFEGLTPALVDLLGHGLEVVGLVVAAYGRKRASAPLA